MNPSETVFLDGYLHEFAMLLENTEASDLRKKILAEEEEANDAFRKGTTRRRNEWQSPVESFHRLS